MAVKDNILGPPKAGHIERNMFQRQLKQDEALRQKLEEETAKQREELLKRREERIQPLEGDHDGLVEYFLDTEEEEMPFEVARCQNLMTPEFFEHMESVKAQSKLVLGGEEEDFREDKSLMLEALAPQLSHEFEKIKKVTQDLVSPMEKLKALLTAKDKKAHILEMAGDNSIDKQFLMLLEENISSAKAAEQEKAVEFMTKLLAECKRYSSVN